MASGARYRRAAAELANLGSSARDHWHELRANASRQRHRSLVQENLERDPRYTLRLPNEPLPRGVSAMIRAKNEAENVDLVLPNILELFDELVFVDNASDDDTLLRAAAIASSHPYGDRLRIATYPFTVARCGEEHWATPENSVHNLAWFYNWCLSLCRFAYVFKWDMDMVPIPDQLERLTSTFDSVTADRPELWHVHCQTIYRAEDRSWWAAAGEINREARLHPNRADVRYRKARQWEALSPDFDLPERSLEGATIYELKDTTVDEFSHWTNTEDLSPRKAVELANFTAVQRGEFRDGAFTRLAASELPRTLSDI